MIDAEQALRVGLVVFGVIVVGVMAWMGMRR